MSDASLERTSSPGRVALSWSVACGILTGGLWPTLLYVGGQGAMGSLLLLSTLLFALGAALGFGFGALLGVAAHDEETGDGVGRSLLKGALWLIPAGALGWLTAVWMALLAPLSRVEGGLASITASLGWLVGLAFVGWGLLEGGRALGRALPDRSGRTGSAVALVLAFVGLLLTLVVTEPTIWGTAIRVNRPDAILLSAGVTIWIVGPVVVSTLHHLGADATP